ncbi:unnamed protein product [Gadus morhua 'NCC']
MEEYSSEVNGAPLSLSCLRLLVPPIRLISAAVWQTVKQKAVLDYGMLEEFVYMVTDMVPHLLKARQRAELIFGLRARLILELCRSEETSDAKIIQPHLDRMQHLLSMWDVEVHNAGVEISDSHFLGLVQSLLRDPAERDRFFKDVFPEEFGPMYDKAIQTLMWQFLSRLEELLPVQTVQQVASLLADSSSVLQDSMESVFHLQELKPLLESQKDVNVLEDGDSSSDTCILPALFLPPVGRPVVAAELTEPMAEGALVYTVDAGLGVEVVETEETEGTDIYIGESGSEVAPAAEEQWFALGAEETATGPADEVAPGLDAAAAAVAVPAEVTVEMEAETEEGRQRQEAEAETEAGADVPLGECLKSSTLECFVLLQRLNAEGGSPTRPVRRNRGLKMQMYLEERRRGGQAPTESDAVDKTDYLLPQQQRRANGPTEKPAFRCTACSKEYRRAATLLRHKCANRSPSEDGPGSSLKEEEEEEGALGKEASADGENQEQAPVSPGGAGQGSVFSCPHCSVEFKCKQTFRCHLRNICYSGQLVDPEGPGGGGGGAKRCFPCDECGKAFRYKSTLDSHKHTHNPLYCDVCAKLVRDAEALAMHKASHTPFQCNLCADNFRVFKELHKHYVDAHSPRLPFDCGHCGAGCGSLKRLIRHEWKHTGHQPFQCPHCPKRFRSYSDLQEHQKKHTKAYPFLCWECGKKFRHNVTLTRHVQREHRPGQDPAEKARPPGFVCTHCSKSFTARRCLLRHVDFYHMGLGHPCSHCGKGFSGKDALVRHMLIHTGEKPYKCDDCDKCFRSASERKVHGRYHTGERPFRCKVCLKGFVQSCFLTLHMRTHTGERPYPCAACPKAFSSLHGLKRHKRLVHA